MTKLYFFIFIISFSQNVFCESAESLINKYGKSNIMKAIASSIDGGFTAEAEGVELRSPGPDLKYINARTLSIDIVRSGLTPDNVKRIIEKNEEIERIALKQKDEQELQERLAAEQEKISRITEEMNNVARYWEENRTNEKKLNIEREDLVSPKTDDTAQTAQTATTPAYELILLYIVVIVFSGYLYKIYQRNRVLKRLSNEGFKGIDGAVALFRQNRLSDALLVGGKNIIGRNKSEKRLNLKKLVYLYDGGFTGLNGAKTLYSHGRKREALILGKAIYPLKNIDQIELFLQGFEGLEGAKSLYTQGRVEDALVLGQAIYPKSNLDLIELYLQGFTDVKDAESLYTQGRVEDALVIGKAIWPESDLDLIELYLQGHRDFFSAQCLYKQGRKEEALVLGKANLPGKNIRQVELGLQGFLGLNGVKKLYTKGRVEDAVILFKTIDSVICPPVIGLLPKVNSLKELQAFSKAESILILQLISYPKCNYLTIGCRGFGGGFLLYGQDKKIVFYNMDNKESIEFWDLSFKDVLGTAIVKNERQIIKTTKPNGIGNAIVGGLLLGGDGAIMASVLSSEKTTSTTEIDKMILEIVLDCKSRPVHRIDCTKNPEDIEIFQTLLELVMLDVNLPKQQESVDIEDHIRMLRLKFERQKHEGFNIQ